MMVVMFRMLKLLSDDASDNHGGDAGCGCGSDNDDDGGGAGDNNDDHSNNNDDNIDHDVYDKK